MRELELLAPARTADIGIAAIDCGADAVYIAGPEFGARQAAGNPVEDIRRLCIHAHRFGARIFAALNTIIYDSEYGKACDMLLSLQDAGVDAVIVQDLGLSSLARSLASVAADIRVPLHASTQCSIRTPERAAFLESLGFSRLILERELPLSVIREIRSAVDCELEFFVHGALCVCYSGQCYISENISGRSANRGACIQACRSLYDLVDGTGRKLVSSRPLLSLKDYNLESRLGDLAEAGVSSFKIEGRLKNASYVKNTVRKYSMALDRLVESGQGRYRRASFGKVAGGFEPDLSKTFNRGYTELYLDGRRGRWASENAAKSMGEPVGKVEILNADKSMFRIRTPRSGLSLSNGDGFCFVDRRHEVVGFRGDVCQGFTVRCKPVPELFDGADLYRNIDIAFERSVESGSPSRRIQVELTVNPVTAGGKTALEISAETEDGRSFKGCLGKDAEPASNPDKMLRTLVAQLSKASGSYSFSVKPFSGESLPFLPVSAVNSFRRMAAESLDAAPCIRRPLHMKDAREVSLADARLKFSGSATYKDNISNHVSENLFKALGTASVEPAYELRKKPGAELMRTKYCIRYQFGRCPVHHGRSWPGKLFLENNGRTFPLGFDCADCEMTVLAPDQ